LVLDGEQIQTFDKNDQEFLNKFTGLKKLQMINTGLSSLDNLPDCKLEKLYLNDNNLSGEEVKKLCKYKADLVSLRLVQNKILTVKDVEDLLVACPKLKKLDVSSNKCCDTPEKENELFKKIFANKDHEIEVLNSKDKDG